MDKRKRAPLPDPIPENKRQRPTGSCVPIIKAKVAAEKRAMARKGTFGTDGFPKGGKVVNKFLAENSLVLVATIQVAGELAMLAGRALVASLFGIGRQASNAAATAQATRATVAVTRSMERGATRSRLPRNSFGGEAGGSGTVPNSARRVDPAPKPETPMKEWQKSSKVGADVRKGAKATLGDELAYSHIAAVIAFKPGHPKNARDEWGAKDRIAKISPALAELVFDHNPTDPVLMEARRKIEAIRGRMGGALADPDAVGAQLVSELEPTAQGYIAKKRMEEAEMGFEAGGPRPQAANGPALAPGAKVAKPKDDDDYKPAMPRMK